MRKAMWLLVVLCGLFMITPAAAPAPTVCEFPLENGKLNLEQACGGGGTVDVKVSSSLTNACAALICDGDVTVVVSGNEGACTGAATLDAEGDAHTKTQCKNGANTKIEIIADSCVGSPCD
jgi:hypothetical protein